ncbi:hypothetical protein MBLNU230_g3351t1 [Neophaeotheca triangularis]
MVQDARVQRSSLNDSVRMFVCETDEPEPATQKRRGTFGDVFDDLFKKAGDNHDPPLGVETLMRHVVEPDGGRIPEYHEFDGIDAILITGSMYDAHGDDEWIEKLLKLLRELWTKRPDMRFSGVCFGHQILCRLLGSQVSPHPSGKWEIAHTKMWLTPLGKQLFNTQNNNIYLHQMHQDYVVHAPTSGTSDLINEDQEVHIWGSSEHTEVQGIYIPKRLFTSQGHLGFDEGMVKTQIQARVDSGGVKDLDHAEKAKETADMEHDGQLVAEAILRFFHGDDDEVHK